MRNDDLTKTSKFLSYVLRHSPESIGLQLDAQGWASVAALLALAQQQGRTITSEHLEDVVAQNDKQRFTFNADRTLIRANQGHSIPIDLGLVPQQPPHILFHGTATRFLDSIRAKGLVPGDRQFVHLSSNRETATKVGQRHGKPIVLVVQAAMMYEGQHQFLLSKNGVWLTRHVPAHYLSFPSS